MSHSHRVPLLLLAPYLLGALLLIGVPGLVSFGLAFTAYDGLAPPTWRGLQNFDELFRDPVFLAAVRNTLLFVALAVPLRLLGALLLALLFRERRRGTGIYRATVFLPTIVPNVAYALIWLWIYNPFYGPLNLLLGAAGLPTPAWLASEATALVALVGMTLFQVGEGFVVLLVGMHDIPPQTYDAARVDGANRWQRFRHITLPLLAPWLLLLSLRDTIVLAQENFVPAYLMTEGGPYYATTFLPLLVYEEAFDRLRFGHGAAIMLLLFVSLGGLVIAGLVLVWRMRLVR